MIISLLRIKDCVVFGFFELFLHNLSSFFCFSETCSCPETLTIVENPSSLDDEHISLAEIIEGLVKDVCGVCHAFGKTKLNKTTVSRGDVNINYPVVVSSAHASSGTFVAVINVPGLAVVQRKATPAGMEKEIASAVFTSWPIFAISGAMTLLAGLLIWVLVRIFILFFLFCSLRIISNRKQ